MEDGNMFEATKQFAAGLVTGFANLLGLGDIARNHWFNTDRNKEKVEELELKLAEIRPKYQSKIDYLNNAIDLLYASGLPIPSSASAKISQKREELMKERDRLQRNKDLVDELGTLAVKNLDTSNMETPDESIYQHKDKMGEYYKEKINENISKDIEERL